MAPLAAIVALGSFERVDAAAGEKPIVPGAAVDEVLPAIADQGVGEGRALDALKAKEPVAAISSRLVGAQRDPHPAAAPARDGGGKGGGVA